jgi:nicotinate-nucleotide pyrophosphorylase (carboxylating)
MNLQPLDPAAYRDLVRRALDEDLKSVLGGTSGDITTDATVSPTQWARGDIRAKSDCVVAGLDVAFECFRVLQPGMQTVGLKSDGVKVTSGTLIASVAGDARTLLVGERTALNFLQRMSGIATQTRRFVEAAGGKIVVLDTRKTTPTLRALEKYAVRCGAGSNHRFGLFDAVLIKDNHIALAGGVAAAIAKVRQHQPGLPVEVEADTLAQVDEALAVGAETILVDNMSTADIREAVRRSGGRAKIEISGGVTLDRMAELAATGADYVSVGALTHSAQAVDISFDISPVDYTPA